MRLVDGWLDDLERILGGVKDEEIDPRFVEGLLVEVNRSLSRIREARIAEQSELLEPSR